MHNNQRGLSLVEILAGIVLLGIITTLTSIIITNSFDRNDTSAKEISLKQDTNLMISQLRKEFYDGKDAPKPDDNIICLDDQQGRVHINLENSKANGKKLESENGKVCIKGFDRNEPLRLKVFTENDNGKQINIETTLKKGGNKKVSYGDMDPCDSTKYITWNSNDNNKTLPCGKSGNFKFTNIQNTYDKSKECEIKGNILVSEQFDPKMLNLKVTKNACFLGSAQPNNSVININGNSFFKNEVQFEGNSELLVGKNANFISDQNTKFYSSYFKIMGNLVVKNSFETNSTQNNIKNFEVGGTANFGNSFQINHTIFTVVKNSFLKGETQIKNGSTLVAGGSLETNYNSNDFEIKNSSAVFIYKDATFRNQSVQNGSGNGNKLCIKGNVKPNSIKRDDQANCNYPPINSTPM